MNIITIIVPIYNVESFLDDCLMSIVNQTYDNVEVILVEDKSRDGSLSIARKYKKQYGFKLIEKEVNYLEEKFSYAKKIYLSFDDGPTPEVTNWVLEVLQQFNVKATFFCIGENVEKHPVIYQNILDEGHAIGNHTNNHIKGWKTKTKAYLDILANLSVNGRKTLLVTAEHDSNVYLSGRNIPYASTTIAKDLNTYAVMKAGSIILTENSVEKIKELFV